MKTHKRPQNPSKPRKTVFILPALTAGGAERVLITLMNGLDRNQFTPEFITINEQGPLRDLVAPDIPFHALGSGRVSHSLHKLLFRLRKLKPDIVVTTMAHTNFALLLLKPFLPGKPRLIVREAITPSFILETVPQKKLVTKAYQWLYPHADLVISPARIIINEFAHDLNMNTDNHICLRNPVDTDKIRGDQQIAPDFQNAGNRDKTTHFIAAGRLHSQKGFDRLITALPSLKQKNWHLTILGEGTERPALESLIKQHKLEKHVTLPGLSRHPWPHMAAADAFLMPSRWEGLPNTVLESLACGTPVIATKESGGIEEIAALTKPGNVTVVDSMDNFIDAMNKVQPSTHKQYRTSLLPPEFEKPNVFKKFADLLLNKTEDNQTTQKAA